MGCFLRKSKEANAKTQEKEIGIEERCLTRRKTFRIGVKAGYIDPMIREKRS